MTTRCLVLSALAPLRATNIVITVSKAARKKPVILTSTDNAGIVGDAFQRNAVELFDLHRFLLAQIVREHVADRFAGLWIDRSPSGDPIGLAVLDGRAAVKCHAGNALAGGLLRCAGVIHAADAHHVAA